jgi:hypothetical protein
MIDFNNSKISVEFQCSLLGISRSTVYYKPRRVKQRDLDLMRIIDEQYLETPFTEAGQCEIISGDWAGQSTENRYSAS